MGNQDSWLGPPASQNANLEPLIEGPAISLAARHAKIRRSYDRATGNDALDRLLNATDGILGQSSKTIFLLTTNVELATINPALARPGRCLAAIHFEVFTTAEARAWLGERAAPPRPMTLAELYELEHGTRRSAPRQSTGLGQYL